jgi:MraZ protein
MIGFLGEYEVTLDAKGRFLLPAGFKKQLPEEGAHQFVLNRGIEPCLSLYPIKSWEPIFEQVNKLNDFDPKVRQFRRFFLNGASPVELDSAGRILISKSLLEYAGITKDAILIAALNKIEIWDVNRYKQLFESFSPEQFSSLANEVMNNPGLPD